MIEKLEFDLDTLGLVALILTFISILLSFNLSTNNFIISIGIFLIILASYAYILFKKTINNHATEIKKINEKINIYKDISDLKAKVDLLMKNFKMEKRGKTDIVEIFIRIIQVAAIIFAVYIILKALGVKF